MTNLRQEGLISLTKPCFRLHLSAKSRKQMDPLWRETLTSLSIDVQVARCSHYYRNPCAQLTYQSVAEKNSCLPRDDNPGSLFMITIDTARPRCFAARERTRATRDIIIHNNHLQRLSFAPRSNGSICMCPQSSIKFD